MQIDKSIGKWSNNLNYLDDIAYQLYVEYTQSQGIHLNLLTDQLTIHTIYNNGSNNGSNNFLNIFYEESKLILRKEKIEKIKGRYGNR